MRRSLVVVAALILATLAVVPAAVAGNPGLNFGTHLSSAPGADSSGQGQGLVRFESDLESAYFKLNVANIENVTMAHIHVADTPGGNGPPVLWLYPSSPPPMLLEGRVQGTIGEGTVTAQDLVGPLAGHQLDSLRDAIREGRAYINVHTLQYPGGEIRGQL